MADLSRWKLSSERLYRDGHKNKFRKTVMHKIRRRNSLKKELEEVTFHPKVNKRKTNKRNVFTDLYSQGMTQRQKSIEKA